MKKKIISLFLSVVMIFSMVPTYTVFAADACDHVITTENWATLSDSFKAEHPEKDPSVNADAPSFVSVILPASCDKDGWQLDAGESTGFCVLCGELIGEKTILPQTGHNMLANKNDDGTYDMSNVIKQPTCTTNGEAKCVNHNYEFATEGTRGNYSAKVIETDCNKVDSSLDKVKATGHTWGEGTITKEPGCVDAGETTYTCLNDPSHKKTETIPPATGHTPIVDEKTKVEPTCTTAGKEADTVCSVCGEVLESGAVIPATGHAWSEWTTVKETSCAEAGKEQRVCSNDQSHVEDRVIPQLAHTYGEAVTVEPGCLKDGYDKHVCTVCGYEKRDNIVKGHPHQIADPEIEVAATCTTEGIQTGTCSLCGEKEVRQTIPAINHDWDEGKVTVVPTCDKDGEKVFTCKNDSTHTKTVKLAKLEHDYKLVSSTEATCIEDAVDTFECKNCGDVKTVITAQKLGHDVQDWTVVLAPTCDKDGYEEGDCTRCGYTIKNILASIGHNFVPTVVDPTCETQGKTVWVCQNDASHTYEDTFVDALGHIWDAGVVTVAPTCTETGSKLYTCDRDASHTYTEILPAINHDYVAGTVVAPTCEEDGYTIYVCQNDASHTENRDIVPAIGHDWDNGTVTVAPTCTAEGEMTYTCLNDPSHTKTEAIAKIPHNFVVTEKVFATCTKDGRLVYTCTECAESYWEPIPATGHNYDDYSIYDCLHGVLCTNVDMNTGLVCGDENDDRDDSIEFTDNVSASPNGAKNSYFVEGNTFNPDTDIVHTGHDYKWEFVPATCEFDAYWIGTCIRERVLADGTVVTCPENDSIDNSPVRIDCHNTAFGHDWALLDDNSAKQPTCTEDGVRHYMCLNDHSHTYTEKLPAMGHNFLLVDSVAATCVEGGYDLYECQNADCEESYKEYKTQALPHDWKVTDRVPATCTEAGYDVYTCDKCGLENNRTTSPAEGHNYVVTGSVAATCTTQGYDIYTCTKCQDTYNKTTTSASGHQFVAKSFTEPTCTTAGYTTYVCINNDCNETFSSDFISANGHNFVADVTAPTCASEGYTTFTCDVCNAKRTDAEGNVYKTDITKPVDHVFNVVETEKATCTADGKVVETCINCGYEAVEVLPATGHNYGKTEITEATCEKGGFTKHICTNDGCTESYITDETDIAEHVLKSTSTVKATCTTDGSVSYACANCEYTFVEVLPATGHNYGKTETTEATCKDGGFTKHICTNDGCTESYISDVTDKADHVIILKNSVAPTCLADGLNTYACENCGDEFSEVIPATGNHVYFDNADHEAYVATTCETDGRMIHECKVCGVTYSTVIPATGHNYGKAEIVDATCTDGGYTKLICTNPGCDSTYVTDETDKIDHVLSVVASVAPTCTEDGSKTYSCANCDYTLTEKVPAVGHKYGNAETHSATCINKKYTEINCETCGERVYYKAEGALAGHKSVTSVTTKATTKKDGKLSTKCSVCNKTLSTTAIPAIKTVSLSYTSTAYTGKSKKPSVSVVDKNGKKISNSYYTVKYTNNKAIGTAKVTVTFKGRYSGTVTKTFKIVPKGVGISSVSTKNKTIKIAYGKVANATGYQIQYSTSSKFSSYKTVTVKSNKTTSATIKKSLKKNKKYYIRIRAYKVVNGSKYYGAWTTTSKVCK